MSRRGALVEIWRTLDDDRRLDLMDRYFRSDYVRHSEEGDLSLSEFREALEGLQAGFPDLHTEIVDALEDGNRVAYRWRALGTHEGVYLGAPPTHKSIEASGITISTFDADGLIVEDWASWSKVSVLHALGIIPLT